MTGGTGTQHKTKSKESIITCNLQGTRLSLPDKRESESRKDRRGGVEIERGGTKIRYCSRLFRDGNERELSLH